MSALSTGWQSGSITSWPTGTKVGDQAVLVVVHPSFAFYSTRGWSRQGGWAFTAIPGTGTNQLARFYGQVFTRRVTSLSSDVFLTAWGTLAMVVVVPGSTGTGRVRYGSGAVPVRPGGSAVVFYRVPSSSSSAIAGLDDQGGVGSVAGQYGLSAHARVGYAQASTQETLGGDAPTSDALALELLPPVGPATPTPLLPEAGNQVSAGVPVDFEWLHRPSVPGGRQDAYQLRVDVGSGWRYWSASTSTLSTSEVTNLSAVSKLSLPGAVFTANLVTPWQVRTREGLDGQWSDWSPLRTFEPVTPPSVSLSAPSGTLSEDLTPTLAWSTSTPRGVQTAWQAQVVIGGVVAYDTGVVPGPATNHTTPALDWVNGGAATARVRVQQTGGSWSSWAESSFSVTWTPPATPVVSAEVLATGGVQLTLGDVVAGRRVELERITPEGLWETLTVLTAIEDDPVLPPDLFAPYGVATAYRARQTVVLDGQPLVSEWGLSNPVTSMDRRNYLCLASRPLTSSIEVHWSEDSEHTHTQDVSVGRGLGDSRPRVAYGTAQGRTGKWTFNVLSRTERDALLGLLAEGEPLLLRVGGEFPEKGGRVRSASPPMLVQRSGEITESRLWQGPTQARTISFPWVEADPVDPSETVGLGLGADGTLTIATDSTLNPDGTITIAI